MGKVVDFNQKSKSSSQNSSSELIYFSHSTVLITSEIGKKILIDPWLREEGNPTCPKSSTPINNINLEEIDAIVLSHGHSDHSASCLKIAEISEAKVFAVYELANLLIKDGLKESQVEPMGKGGKVQLVDSEVCIHLTQAFHSSSYTLKNGSTHYAGEPAGIVIQLESGKCIYHAGDTLLFSDMALISEKFKPEIALLPIGDRFTMGIEDAAKAAEIVSPKKIIPIHYNTFDALNVNVNDFKAALKKSSIEVQVLDYGESIKI